MNLERPEIYRRDRQIALNSPEDSEAKRQLNHIYGASATQLTGLCELIIGAFNHSQKNILLGSFIYLSSIGIIEFRRRKLHHAVQEFEQ